MAAPKDTTPRHMLDLLQRVFACNKGQLAARLGINPATLSGWLKAMDAGQELSPEARLKMDAALRSALRAANVEWKG